MCTLPQLRSCILLTCLPRTQKNIALDIVRKDGLNIKESIRIELAHLRKEIQQVKETQNSKVLKELEEELQKEVASNNEKLSQQAEALKWIQKQMLKTADFIKNVTSQEDAAMHSAASDTDIDSDIEDRSSCNGPKDKQG